MNDYNCDFFIKDHRGVYYIPLVNNNGYSLINSPAVYTGPKVVPDFSDAINIMNNLEKWEKYPEYNNDINRIKANAELCRDIISLLREHGIPPEIGHKVTDYLFGRKRRSSKRRSRRRSKNNRRVN